MNLAQQWQQALERHDVPGGAVAVYRDGKITDSARYGVANLKSGVEVNAHTLFQIGSNTKVFNVTLLMQLVDEGLVRLDDPVQKYLPDFTLADPERARVITVKMLVNHSSGIDSEMMEQWEFDKDRIVDGYEFVRSAPSLFPPGSDLAYSNGATLVAGHLIQTVRGRGWYELIRERIFEPLEMEYAVTQPVEALRHRVALGHLHDENGKVQPASRAHLPLAMAPAGSTLTMSATDQLLFAAMHLRDGLGLNGQRIISEAAARQMREVTAQSSVGGFTQRFGLAWGIGEDGVVRHAGGTIGGCAQLILHVPSGTAISLLTNADTGMNAISEVAQAFLTEQFGIDPMAHYKPQNDQPDWKANGGCAGVYASRNAWYQLDVRDGEVWMAAGACKDAKPDVENPVFRDLKLVPLGDHAFRAVPADGQGLGDFGIFMTMPVGLAGANDDGIFQRFRCGGRVYARVD